MKNTNDQKIYEVDGTVKAEIDVYRTYEAGNVPPLATCRHAVLQIQNGSAVPAYVVYDRLLGRIVNGVYYDLAFVLATARYYNEDETAPQDMAPNGTALGLHFPTHT